MRLVHLLQNDIIKLHRYVTLELGLISSMSHFIYATAFSS